MPSSTDTNINAPAISAITALITSIAANIIAIYLSNRTIKKNTLKDITQNTIQRIENLDSDIQKYWRATAHNDELGHAITTSFLYLSQDIDIIQQFCKKKIAIDDLYENFFTTSTGGSFQSPNRNAEHDRASNASIAAQKLSLAIRHAVFIA